MCHNIENGFITITAHIISVKNRSFWKLAKALLGYEKTICYERMAFILDLSYIKQSVGVNSLSLTLGGFRAYNPQNLYSKKTI